MGGARHIAHLAIISMLLSGCESLGLPDQGFVTRDIGGTFGSILHDTFEPSTELGGDHLPSGNIRSLSQTTPIDECERSARERASDVNVQGFDADTQRKVYEATLQDCHKWSGYNPVGDSRSTRGP